MENFHPQPKPFVLTFNEYIKNISEKPVSEVQLLRFKEQNEKEFLKIQALLANDRVSRQIKEFVVSGLAEELTDKPSKIDPHNEDLYVTYLERGFRIETTFVYDETMQIAGHRFLKTPAQLEPTQSKQMDEISIKYAKEYDHKFRREQEANDKYFEERVAAGEMTFIGQMTFDEYIELMNKRPKGVSIQNFELIPCFEGDSGWWTNNNKVYAYNGKNVETENASNAKI